MLKAIQKLLTRDPFVPFRIVMTSGHVYEVAESDLGALGEGEFLCCHRHQDMYALLRLNQIVAVEVQHG